MIHKYTLYHESNTVTDRVLTVLAIILKQNLLLHKREVSLILKPNLILFICNPHTNKLNYINKSSLISHIISRKTTVYHHFKPSTYLCRDTKWHSLIETGMTHSIAFPIRLVKPPPAVSSHLPNVTWTHLCLFPREHDVIKVVHLQAVPVQTLLLVVHMSVA